MKTHRFPVGLKFTPLGRYPQENTITDQYTTTNSKGEVVGIKYAATHLFCGQTVTSHDVADAAIARGLRPEELAKYL